MIWDPALLAFYSAQVDRIRLSSCTPVQTFRRSGRPPISRVAKRRRVDHRLRNRGAEYTKRAEMRRSLRWFRDRQGAA